MKKENENGKTLTADVWEHAPSRYRGSELVVLLKLAGLTNADGYAYPSLEYVAKACGISIRMAQRITKRLRKDGIIKVTRGRGTNRFFVQRQVVLTLSLAVPRDYQDKKSGAPEPTASETPVVPAQAAPTAAVRDAAWLSQAIHTAIVKDVPEAEIPSDWYQSWPVALQTLFDAGHDWDTLRKLARYAINTEWWKVNAMSRGALGFVEHFDKILDQYKKQEQKAA
jgi:hypothetical protein